MPDTEILVYTALMGDYEKLSEQPIIGASSARFVCYTDNPDLRSDEWEVLYRRPSMAWDPTRAARKIKILGTKETRSARSSLWIDNRVILLRPPEEFVPTWLDGCDVALPLHSYRETVEDEFAAVLSEGFDVPSRVREQLHHLRRSDPHVLTERPYWTALLARQWSADVEEAMQVWNDLVHAHSRRDQLSVNFALRPLGHAVNGIAISNFESPLHRWLHVSELPKSKDILFSRGYKYRLTQDVSDRVRGSRGAVGLRTRYNGMLDRKFNRLRRN